MDGSETENGQEAGCAAACAVLEKSEQRRCEEFEVRALQLSDDAANGNEPGVTGAVDNLRFWEVEEYAKATGQTMEQAMQDDGTVLFAAVPRQSRGAVISLLELVAKPIDS